MSTTTTDTKSKSRVIFEGELFIQGWFSTWRSRYCTLCVNRTLCAYNNKDQVTNDTQPKHILDLSTVITIKQTQNPNLASSKKNKKNRFIFEITTPSQDILLSSNNEDTSDQWIHHLKVYVFGDIIHCGYMTKQGFIKKSWKNRYFTLSANWKEVRYFENNKLSKNGYKGSIALCGAKVLRSYVKIHRNEFIIEILTPKRTYVFINEFHDSHIDWMNKLEEVLTGHKSCCYCDKNKLDTFGDNIMKSIYYKMNSLHEGILHTFIPMDKNDINKGGKWEKNYYAIDGRTMRLFYTKRIIKMESFQNALIEKDFYEEYISQEMDGYYLLFGEQIEMIDGSIDDGREDSPSMIYMGTSTIGEIGECDADDVMGPGFVITPTPGGDMEDMEDGKDDNKEEIYESYDKFRYKFSIGEYIFGVGSSKEAKLWVYGLKNAIDFNMREVYNYSDEKHYLCKKHLSLLICRFYYDKERVNGKCHGMDDVVEIPFGAYKYLIKCIGTKCWDNDNLVSF